jgi:predicted AAA+ superfamily ATPase
MEKKISSFIIIMPNFFKDLKLGNSYENVLASYLMPFYKNINVIKEKCKYYDIICYTEDDKEESYEVKSDRLSIKTGNIAIEYKSRKKDSGILITKANFYAYYIIKNETEYDLYIIPTEEIKNKINSKEYKRTIKGGDNWSSEMYLFDLTVFKDYKK